MGLKAFQIPRPSKDASTEEARAWQVMQQQLELKLFTPALTGFTGTAPTVNAGYFQLLGPVVFFFIRLQSTSNFGWGTGATISLPFSSLVYDDGTTFPQYAQPIIDTATATEVNNECPLISGNTLMMFTALSSTGGPTEVAIQGFYLRNGSPLAVPVGGG